MVSAPKIPHTEARPHLCRPTIEKMNAFAPQHSRLFKEVRGLHIDIRPVCAEEV